MFVIAIQGFSHLGSLHSPIHFASNLPDRTPLVLIFGAQASRGIVAADHPYVSRHSSRQCRASLHSCTATTVATTVDAEWMTGDDDVALIVNGCSSSSTTYLLPTYLL